MGVRVREEATLALRPTSRIEASSAAARSGASRSPVAEMAEMAMLKETTSGAGSEG